MIRRLPIQLLFAALLSFALVGCSDDTQTDPGDNAPVDEADGAADADGPDAPDSNDTDEPDADEEEEVGEPDAEPDADDTGDAEPDVPEATCEDHSADCDFDGLSDCEEEQIGTDPCNSDTDGDGVNDLQEWRNGSDPRVADTDGDGLDDGEEADLGLDPTKESTYDDGIIDSDRWIVSACDNPSAEDVSFRTHGIGNWLLALPPAFNANYTELAVNGAAIANRRAAAMFDDPSNEVAGFLMSTQPSRSWDGLIADYMRAARAVGETDQETDVGEFLTHDFRPAMIGRFVLETDSRRTTKDVREELFQTLTPYAGEVSGFPTTSGGDYKRFRVSISVIKREYQHTQDHVLTSLAIAPFDKYENRDLVRFRMDDLINTTNIASAEDGETMRCDLEEAMEDPGADFYWMLDHSGSMNTINSQMATLANEFYNELNNTSMDWRLGVSQMNHAQGRLRSQAGWHTDHNTFDQEVQHVIDQGGGYEWGLQHAQDGIEYMKGISGNPPDNMKIRPDAQVVTIWVSDEEAETIQDNPLGGATGQQLLNNFIEFFKQHTIGFAVVGDGEGCGDHGEAYQIVAGSTGGSHASLCSTNLREIIDDIIQTTSGAVGYELPDTPISSSLRVKVDDEWVPRSRENGFDYFAQFNTIAFFGDYRPEHVDTPGQPSDHISVTYRTFVDLTKNE